MMRIAMELFTLFSYLILVRLVTAKLAVKISKKTGMETSVKKDDPGFHQLRNGDHPQPLPTPLTAKFQQSSYTSLYQGLRYKNDTRVFRKRFGYDAMLKGQQIVCSGLFDCVISHLAIESTEAIPVLLKGGAGYRHFMAVIKAKPHRDLRGQVRAYCRSNYAPLQVEEPVIPRRRFFFGDRLATEKWR